MFSEKLKDNFLGKSVLNSLESNICLLDEKGNIEFANASWFNFAKDNNAEIGKISEGCNYLEVCDNARGDDKELAEQAAAGIRSVIAGKEDKFELEYPCHSPSVERWFLVRVTPYQDLENTSMRKVVVFHEDITKIKQEESLLNSTIEALEHPFYLIDINNYQVLKANTASGMKKDKKTTCYSLTHNRSKPCSGEEHPCPMEIIKCTKQSITVDHLHYDEEGNTKNVEVHAYPIFNDKGELIQIIEYCLDITERKQAEKKFQETYKKIEIKQRQIDQELEKAKKIHERTLLGDFSKAGSLEDILLEAHYCPAKQIGGDFYNFIRRENKLIIYLSDVTGHGLEAALISTFVKETIENYADLETGELTPEKILTHVYKHYSNNDFPEDYFVCLCIAVLDLDTYELSYSTVGMQYPLFLKLANGSCINLQSEGPPISSVIGLELMDFRADSVTLIPGSIVLFYTDGIAEQMNEDNRPYEKRLKNTFYSQQSKFPPKLIKQVINTDFVDFNGSLQGDDDITYVILQINPPERKQYY